QLPSAPTRLQDQELPARLSVPLRLSPASDPAAEELWVMHDGGLEQLDELVRTADDQLLARLSFALAEQDARRTVALRPRPSKEGPPVVSLAAQAFRPYRGVPNLFLPRGARLQPPLRRDAVRKLLADDPEQVTWLYPLADGGFRPETLPDAA